LLTGQAVQDACWEIEYVPPLQSKTLPVAVQALPAGQAVHSEEEVAPVMVVAVPRVGHADGVLDPDGQNNPLVQVVQEVWPAPEKVPALQNVVTPLTQ
jgi:hypothetical protein